MADVIRFPGNALRGESGGEESAPRQHDPGSVVALSDYERSEEGCLSERGVLAMQRAMDAGYDFLAAQFLGDAEDAVRAGSEDTFRERMTRMPNASELLFFVVRDLLRHDGSWPWSPSRGPGAS